MHNTVPKIAAVSDLTGFGRCALTVTIPIISSMGIQCCPVPTALFSNHPAYPQFYSSDLTALLPDYVEHWKKLDLKFDGILSGYLSSPEQIDLTRKLITDCAKPDTVVIVDPVMGDHGRLYSVFTEDMCIKIKELAALAHILTPNLTECCRLTDTPYHDGDWSEEELLSLMEKMHRYPAEKIAVSGITSGDDIVTMIYDKDSKKEPSDHGVSFHRVKKTAAERSGTGDVFSAVIAAGAVNRLSFYESVALAGNFVRDALLYTEKHNLPSTDGVYFEPLLGKLVNKRENKEDCHETDEQKNDY